MGPTEISTLADPVTPGPRPTSPTAPSVGPGLTPRSRPQWLTNLIRRSVALDLLGGVLGVVIAAVLNMRADVSAAYVVASCLLPVVWCCSCGAARSYEPRFLGSGSEEFRRVFEAGLRLVAVMALVSYGFHLGGARAFVLVALPVTVAVSLVLRYASRSYLRVQRRAGTALNKVVVVGRERSCAELIRQLQRDPRAGFSVVGACVDRSQGPDIEGVPVVATSDTILHGIEQTGADTVAVGAWSDLSQADLRRLSWELEGSGVALVVAPSLTDVTGPRLHIRPIAGLPLLHVDEPEFSGARRLLKGTADRLAAALILTALSPLLVVVAVLVRLTSSGPALFRQQRIGADGKPFTMYKFRSMYSDSTERLEQLQASNDMPDGLLFKMKDDPRVTPLGRWTRRYSIDELPQLLNIVKGDMSAVGPRPPLPVEVERYGYDVRRRLLVKPGLTGLWQISGRSDLSWEESVHLDLHYVENWSLTFDLVIVWRTLFAVIKRQGAY